MNNAENRKAESKWKASILERAGHAKSAGGGQPCGRAVKFTHSALVAQGFDGSDPGCRHGTAYQATLRQHPPCHNLKDPQRRIYNYVLGGFGEKNEKNKIFKKKKDKNATPTDKFVLLNLKLVKAHY